MGLKQQVLLHGMYQEGHLEYECWNSKANGMPWDELSLVGYLIVQQMIHITMFNNYMQNKWDLILIKIRVSIKIKLCIILS